MSNTEARQIAEKLLDGNLNGMAIIHDDVTLTEVEELARAYLALEADKYILQKCLANERKVYNALEARCAALEGLAKQVEMHLRSLSRSTYKEFYDADKLWAKEVANQIRAALDNGGQG